MHLVADDLVRRVGGFLLAVPPAHPHASQVITVTIEQPFDEVYRFLADPLNFPSWAPVDGLEMTYLHGSDWLVSFDWGPTVIRFIEPNLYGVLDYWMFLAGEKPGPATPVRLVPNGPDSELIFLWRQREGTHDDAFAEELADVAKVLQRLKRILEAEPEPSQQTPR